MTAPNDLVAAFNAIPCVADKGVAHLRSAVRSCPACVAAAVSNAASRKSKVVPSRRAAPNTCVLGHGHDSKGEALACPRVYAAASNLGLVVYRPGRPGVPCWSVDPDADTGRPVYVSIDWVIVSRRDRKVVAALDWKGEASHRSWQGRGGAFTRGKRIFETEYAIQVRELRTLDDIEAALAAKEAK